MHVAGLWRYPVKSMGGEPLGDAVVEGDGLAGDRGFGVADAETGQVLSAKREGRLLAAAATLVDGCPRITLPSGEVLDGPGPATDRALQRWLQRPVTLLEAGPTAPTFVAQANTDDDGSGSVTWEGVPGRLVDSKPLHLLTTASLRAAAAARPDLAWHVSRFRPNILIEAGGDRRVEDDWPGRVCTIGAVSLEVVKACERCVMVTRAQPLDDLDRQRPVLQHLAATAGATIGVLARVAAAGAVTVGAGVTIGP